MELLNKDKNPITSYEVAKTFAWLLGIAISAGYIKSGDAEQISLYIPAFAMAASLVINWLVTYYKQRANATPWNADNPLVNYPEDLTGFEPGAAASKKQASE